MSRRGELDLASYDRLFPNQDFLPQKGFGNLIALPLQGRCREAGTSVFLDPATFEPVPDQWALSARTDGCHPNNSKLCLPRATMSRLARLRSSHARQAGISGYPRRSICTIGADLAIPKASLPPALLAELKHLASIHNPLFYERQRLRFSTHQTPRLIRCYDEDADAPEAAAWPPRAARPCDWGGRESVRDRRPPPDPRPAAARPSPGRFPRYKRQPWQPCSRTTMVSSSLRRERARP